MTVKKQLIILITGIFLSVGSYTQDGGSKYGEDSITCLGNLSTMSEFVKIKVYEYAYAPWQYCFKHCPASSKNVYIQGKKIIDYKIENAENDEVKQLYIDTLMLLYDKRIENFGQKGKVLGKKGIDLLKHRRDEVEEAYNLLKESTELEKTKVDEAVAVTFVTTSSVLFKQGIIEADAMIANYLLAMNNITPQRPSPKKEKAIEGIEKAFAESGAADCDALIKIFTPKYEESKQDAEALGKITDLLKDAGCQESDLFAKAAESLFSIDPSAKAGANLATVFFTRGELDKANEYFLKAIEIESDNDQKAKYYYQLAAIAVKQKQYSNVKKYCKEAITYKPDYGAAYILLGNTYAASSGSCGSTNFEKAAVYLVAVDKFIKAKSVDATVTEEANNLISKYSKYFPNNEDAFFEGYTDGKSYTVKCWINETTIVRTLKK
jgi:tetratricopeptide (TPR) repeat protein